MKSSLFFTALLLSANSLLAQNTLPSSGPVGIGTTNPTTALDVRGIISVPEIAFRNDYGGDDSDPYRLRKVQSSSDQNWLELQLNDNVDESFRIYGNSCLGYGCGVYSGNLYHSFDASGNVYHKGNVGIGTQTPDAKLAVNGNIHAKEVRVDLQNWPDYVFDNDYKLKPLSSIEAYVKENKHLPELPSAEMIEKNGLQLGEMNKLLVRKIEELTLHLIDKDKELKRISAQYSEVVKSNHQQVILLDDVCKRLLKLEKLK